MLSRHLRLGNRFVTSRHTPDRAPQPRAHIARGLGYSHFARHYSGNRSLFLFLEVLRWFTSLGWLFRRLYGGVAPFGNLRLKGYLRLPEAFRSLSRPSSPPGAKASAADP